MSREYKMIRLDPEVYNELELFRLKRETFSDAVFRLLGLNEQMSQMLKDQAGSGEEVEHESYMPPV